MKKIIRLTESEFISVIKKIVKENEEEWISSMEDIEGESDFSKMELDIFETTKDITQKLPKKEKEILKNYIQKYGIEKFDELVAKQLKKEKIEISESDEDIDWEKLQGYKYTPEYYEEDEEIMNNIISKNIFTSLFYKLGWLAGIAAIPTLFISAGVGVGLGLFSAASKLYTANLAKDAFIEVNKKRREIEKLKQKEDQEKELQKESRIINSIRKKIKYYE